MLSCALDVKENRDVVVSDTPREFLHSNMEDNLHMLLEGMIAEIITKLDPTIYRKHIWYNRQEKQWYMYH